MELKPVNNYRGAQYPSLADYLAQKNDAGTVSGLTLAIALSLVALLLGGCRSIG